jgi:hypothetical protein
MNIRMILILTLWVLFFMSATVATSDAATTFGGSRIIAIDQDQRTITFKTKEGETWTLPVTDPNLLNQPSLKEDQVTIEIDLNDRITKVVKPSAEPNPPRAETEDR